MPRGNFLSEMAIANISYRFIASIFFILLGICGIIYGLYFSDFKIVIGGISITIISSIQFFFFRSMLEDVSDPEEIERLSATVGNPSASSIFGAQVYDIPDFPCKNCGKHRYDVCSDNSGKCTACEETYYKISISNKAKLLGRRNKSGKIE